VDLGASIRRALGSLRRHLAAARAVRARVEELRPDLLINFFEPLVGLSQLRRPLPVPVLAVAHQFMIAHPAYVSLPGTFRQRLGLRAFAALTGLRSAKLALSLAPAQDLPARRLTVSPPLLRPEVFRLKPSDGDYYLVYLLNHGYSTELRAWHAGHPDVRLECFYDRPDAPEVEHAAPNLTFHRLDGAKFLRLMAGCRALATTAGFESAAEAAWFGKPVLVVPVAGHFEQRLNAADVEREGFGLSAERLDLGRLKDLPIRGGSARYRDWVRSAEAVFARAIAGVMAGAAAVRPPESPAVPAPAASGSQFQPGRRGG
jgi:uncharacterized protein (TIGR00661 family)